MKKSKASKKAKSHIGEYIKENKTVFAAYLALRIAVIIAGVVSVLQGDYENFFMCILVLFLFFLPEIVQKGFRIVFPSTLEIIILCFIYASDIMGELRGYYLKFMYWDTLLHITWGFICAAFGFALVDILNRSERIKFTLSPIFLAIVAFCFSMTIGVMWEFGEFTVDLLLKTDMQKDTIVHTISSVSLSGTTTAAVIDNIESVVVNGKELGLGGYLDIGLYDTMEDLFVNFVGALIFSVIGYFYYKNGGKGRFAKRFIPSLAEDEEKTHDKKSPEDF